MKLSGRGLGPFIKGYRNRLATAGLTPADIEAAVAAIQNNAPKVKLKLKRAVIRRITEILEQNGRVVIVRGRKGKIKVFSYEGHQATAVNAKKNKLWEKKESFTRLKPISRASNGLVEAQ